MMFDYKELTHTISFVWSRFPCYKDEVIERLIQKHSPSPRDIERLKFFSYSKWQVWHISFIIIGTIFTIFHCSTAYYLLVTIDYSRPENNIETLTNGLSKFRCVYTNCSRLFLEQNDSHLAPEILKQKLARDMSRLPFFSLCHRKLRELTYPFLDMGSNGFTMVFFSGIAMACFCIVGQIAQLVSPAGDQTLLFVETPELATKMARSAMRKCYVDVLASLFVYRTNDVACRVERRLSRSNRTGANTSSKSKFVSLSDKLELKSEYKSMIEANYHVDTAERVDTFIDDCIPLIKTEWWRQRILLTYKLNFLGLLYPVAIMFIGVSWAFYEFVGWTNSWYDEVADSVEQQGCSIWAQNNHCRKDQCAASMIEDIYAKRRSSIDFHNFKLYFSVFILIQHYYSISVYLLVLNPKNLIAYISTSELLTLIQEIQSQISVIIELASFVLNEKKLIEVYKRRNLVNSASDAIENFYLTKLIGKNYTNFIDHDHHARFGLLRGISKLRSKQTKLVEMDKRFRLIYLRQLLQMEHEHEGLIRPTGNTLVRCDTHIAATITNEQIIHQRIAHEIFTYDRDQDQLATVIDLLEKLYIKVKYFVEIRADYGRTITVQLYYVTVAAYIAAYTMLLLMRHIPDQHLLRGLVLSAFCYFVVCLFGTASLNHYVSVPLKNILNKNRFSFY